MAAGKVKRAQTAGEELANTLSHGFGAMLALGGAIPLVVRAAMSGYSSAMTSLQVERIRSPPLPDITRPSSSTCL